MNLMEGLVTFDGKMQVKPALAEKWTLSPDKKTYTFFLRKDVVWSDGVPLKAQDFAFSWKRLLSPSTAASYAYFLFDIEGAQEFTTGQNKDFSKVGVTVLNDHTLQVRLKQPVGHWIQIPTFWVTFPLREDIVQKHGPDWHKPGRMVTVGPFLLLQHDMDYKVVLTENAKYVGKRGNVDQVVALIIRDSSTSMSLYESGKLDFLTDISSFDLQRSQGHPSLKQELKVFPYLKTGYLGFVISKFPVSNVKVRRAIAMAIDKRPLGDILHGGQTPAGSFVPPPLPASGKNLGLPFDPEKARAELRSSGIDSSKALRLDLVTPSWDKPLMLCQYIQGELKKNLGLEVVIQPFDNKTFRAQLDLHIFPLFQASWSADYPDADNFMSMYLSSSGNNRTAWKSKAFDELVYQARYTVGTKAREKLHLKAQKLLVEDDAILVPLYYEPNMALVKSRVKGLELNPLNYLLLKDVVLTKP